MADLLAHHLAAVGAGAGRAGDLFGDVALERLPLAVDRSLAHREIYAAARVERLPGCAHDAVALPAGNDAAHAPAGHDRVRVPATLHHDRHCLTRYQVTRVQVACRELKDAIKR